MEIFIMKKTFFELSADVLNKISGGKCSGCDCGGGSGKNEPTVLKSRPDERQPTPSSIGYFL